MKIKIAGGCGEHGRNCFYVEGTEDAFIVDCGLMAGEEGGGYPHLSKEDILKIKYVFLTHSHADHTGAIPWLIENGFSGDVIASKETLEQLPFEVKSKKTIDEFIKESNKLKVFYGRTGHCVGSVWYQFRLEDKILFFSGDYVEENFVHEKDLIREKYADMAIIDCAYGKDDKTFLDYCDELIDLICEKKEQYPTLLLPVPKYGRGLELYWFLKEKFPNWKYCADNHFVKQVAEIENSNWIYKDRCLSKNISIYNEKENADIVFVSDPQLRSDGAKKIAIHVLENGYGIMTGTVENNTMSAKLIDEKKMTLLRFPVHLNEFQYKKVVSMNNFKRTIAYHSSTYVYEKEIEI